MRPPLDLSYEGDSRSPSLSPRVSLESLPPLFISLEVASVSESESMRRADAVGVAARRAAETPQSGRNAGEEELSRACRDAARSARVH